jgi:polyhydroxyalkanoate synthesis regulator phasin
MADEPIKNLVKNALLLGVGIASMTKETAEGMARKIQKEYGLNEKDGRKLAKDVLAESKKHVEKAKKQAEGCLSGLLDDLNKTTRSNKAGHKTKKK